MRGIRPASRVISNCPRIELEMTRAEVAEYLCLTIETASRCATKLKLRGLIKFGNAHTIGICDPDALTAIAEGRLH